jgi:Ca-activated chloride channel family protein
MRFAHEHYYYGFWLVAGIIILLVWSNRMKRRRLRVFAQQKLLDEITRNVNVKGQIVAQGVLVLVLTFGILALMRPQWGFHWQEVKRRGLDILIAIDTSKSMLASDVKPNRLERSKLAIKDLIKKLQGDRVGLIAFSGTAFLQCPLTIDYGGFLLALNDITVSTIPRGGTSISRAIETALESFKGGQKQFKVLVIITDGENHEGDPLQLAERARREGIKIFCIGIGTREGELIQVTGPGGKKTFMKDSGGTVIKTRLNEDLLQRIAFTTGGMYVRSSGSEFGLDLIYDERLSKMEKREIKSQMSKLYYERFQIPLALCLVLLLLEPLIGDRKRS